jgi:hypothetical protein
MNRYCSDCIHKGESSGYSVCWTCNKTGKFSSECKPDTCEYWEGKIVAGSKIKDCCCSLDETCEFSSEFVKFIKNAWNTRPAGEYLKKSDVIELVKGVCNVLEFLKLDEKVSTKNILEKFNDLETHSLDEGLRFLEKEAKLAIEKETALLNKYIEAYLEQTGLSIQETEMLIQRKTDETIYRLQPKTLEEKIPVIDEGFKVGDKVFLIYSDSFTKPEIQKGKIVDKRYLIEFNDGSDEILEHNELYKTRQEAEQALKESKDVKQTRQQESRGGDDEKL